MVPKKQSTVTLGSITTMRILRQTSRATPISRRKFLLGKYSVHNTKEHNFDPVRVGPHIADDLLIHVLGFLADQHNKLTHLTPLQTHLGKK